MGVSEAPIIELRNVGKTFARSDGSPLEDSMAPEVRMT